MKKGGIGGGKTITGLSFEKRVSLEDALRKIEGYRVEKDIHVYCMYLSSSSLFRSSIDF